MKSILGHIKTIRSHDCPIAHAVLLHFNYCWKSLNITDISEWPWITMKVISTIMQTPQSATASTNNVQLTVTDSQAFVHSLTLMFYCSVFWLNLRLDFNTFTAGQFSPSAIPGYDLVLPRCQLVISSGAGVRLSYMYWMTSILVSGTWWCTWDH